MNSKNKIYLLGIITLLVFPIPTLVYRIFWQSETLREILDLDYFWNVNTLNGLAFGVLFAIIAVRIFNLPFFRSEAEKQKQLIRELNLDNWDAVFMSICAGVGEELLFRAGIQTFLGPIITSIIFVAIHGYYNPKNWRISVYGLILTLFIFVIAYGYDYFGLWFSVMAHAAYDWVIFNDNRKSVLESEIDEQDNHHQEI